MRKALCLLVPQRAGSPRNYSDAYHRLVWASVDLSVLLTSHIPWTYHVLECSCPQDAHLARGHSGTTWHEKKGLGDTLWRVAIIWVCEHAPQVIRSPASSRAALFAKGKKIKVLGMTGFKLTFTSNSQVLNIKIYLRKMFKEGAVVSNYNNLGFELIKSCLM